MSRPRIGFVGLGHVGQTLFHVIRDHHYDVGVVYNRTSDIAISLTQDTGTIVAKSAEDLVSQCDLVILCVTDDAIEAVADQMLNADWTDKAIVHVSGAKSIDALQSLMHKGAMVGSLHPALPFADLPIARERIIGATFAIEYSHDFLRGWLVEIIYTLRGNILEIPKGKKAQYHLALAIASNYMVTLYAVAENLLAEFSQGEDAIYNALNTLMSATMENLIRQKIPMALTGPLVRGDVETIDAHLQTIRENPLLLDTYINLARLSYPMLTARGTDITQIDKLLEEKSDASDNT